ncbi:chemiosmotic efflux system C protein C (plasmid) [Legionella adelaidensis]|uniref:Chemiosmotic efflux system C protein C n=1 Tax=Legionella adelaidensis TaxID=45056 RepID=A0A0W0R5N8_9GAMM|nr:chemiosmotic efflux system C protein C [Legionella adelaidensis]VEH84997.1 chemiosmotic efflux system C protein C [Legionella adelaidensis]
MFKGRRKQFLALGMAVSLCPILAYAEAPVGLKELNQLAIHHNKDIIASRYAMTIATAKLVQAGLWPNPSLELVNNDDRFFKDEGEYSRSIGLSQALPISGRIAKQKIVACIDIERAHAEIQEAIRQLSSKVANTYYALVVTENRLQQLNYLQRINKELVGVIHERYHAAEVSELDDNIARIEYGRIEQDKQLLRSQLITQYATLNQLIGRNPSKPLRISKTIVIPKALPPLPDLVNHALKYRPDRRGLLLAHQRALADRALAKAERFADWTLGVGVQQDKIVVDGAPPQQADKTLNLTLSVPLPLLSGNQGRILEASATRTQALMAIDAINLTIETEVMSNYGQVQTLTTSLLQTQSTSLRLGLANVKLARDAYQNGQMSLLNVLQVQRQQNDLQATYLTTVEKYYQSYVALCTAIGERHLKGICPDFPSKEECK